MAGAEDGRDERAGLDHVEFLAPPRPSEFPEEWYDLSDARHFWFEWRLRATLRVVGRLGLPRQAPLRVLDVGAGGGTLRDQLEACTEWIVDIADLNPEALRRTRPGRGRTLCHDVLRPVPSMLGAYEVVLLYDVLEHIPETAPFVRAVVDHVAPGGHLLVNVPALPRLFGAYDVAAGHLRRYVKATLAAEFAETPLVVREMTYWGLLMVPVLLARKLVVRRAASPNNCVRSGFHPPGRLAHGLLRSLMAMESAIPAGPPLGSSLLLAGTVPDRQGRAAAPARAGRTRDPR